MLEFSDRQSRPSSPASATQLVRRGDLLDKLMGAAGTLTLLSAPAGFGKTTVMAQAFHALEQGGIAAAWLSANPTDNDLPRFLSCLDKLVKHLRLCPNGNDSINALLNPAHPYAIFIDDLETIQERSVLALLHELVSHLPNNAFIIVASRVTPLLSLSSLRVGGRLTEIGASDLRFGLEETAELFDRQLGYSALTEVDVSYLHAKTEGWAAALWLASIALKQAKSRGDFISQFSGSTGTVAQYLTEVVLGEQPLSVRRFLERISVLKQFNVSVCAALNPDQHADRLLQQLADQSLVIPIESKPGTWRFHGMFADYLRSRFVNEDPEAYSEAHLTASRWFEQHNQMVLAVDHAVQSKQFGAAVELLGKYVEPLLQQGRMRLLSRWFSAIPEAMTLARPALFMKSIWATALTEGAHQAAKKLHRIDWRNSDDADVRNHGAALYPTLLGMKDQCEEALKIGMDALETLEPGHDFASATLLNAIAHQILIIGDPKDAQRMVDAARRLHGGESIFNRMYSETTEGLIDMLHGRLRHASTRFRLAVEATHGNEKRLSHGNAWAGVLYAATTYEGNDLKQTSHLINVYLPLAREVGIPDHLIMIYLLRCRLAFIEADLETALETLTELEYLGHSRKLPRAVAAAQLERAKILLIQGNATASHDELCRAEDPEVWARECKQRLHAHDIHYLRLAKLRWEIHFGDPVSALKQIDCDLREARNGNRLHRALVLQLLKVLGMQRCDNSNAANRELEIAFGFAAQEGYMRTILDEGPAMGHAVLAFKRMLDSREGPNHELTCHVGKVLEGFGPLSHVYSWNMAPAPAKTEALTRKEVEVLKLLTEGCSNVDLSARLHVSDSTVRTHLRNINSKLGTSSRTQALAAARRLNLIS